MVSIHLVEALNQFGGCFPFPVSIGVIDTGADLDHPELIGRIVRSVTAVGGNAEDINGHGTRVTGIIAAIPSNGIGIAGLHPHASLSIYKYTNQNPPEHRLLRILNTAILIREAVENGDDVINISSGFASDVKLTASGLAYVGCNPERPRCDGELKRAVEYARDHGVMVVVAGPETGQVNKKYPAAFSTLYENVIAVTSSTPTGTLASDAVPGSFITVAAPGGEPSIVRGQQRCRSGVNDCILTLDLNGGYAERAGTSFAAPHVTGIIALMLSANPNLSPAQIRAIIVETASDFATPTNGGGAGIINAEGAVLRALELAQNP
jgi:subtilisin family serine protease